MLDWFDEQVARLQRSLHQNDFFNDPAVAGIDFDPGRRSRLFDALFADNDVSGLELGFHENPSEDRVECQISTGCGDFFRPEDITLNVEGRRVEFIARREQKSEDGKNYTVREVRRVFVVPENADADKLNAEITVNGKVLITAPLLNPKPKEKSPNDPVPLKINKK